MAKHKVVEGDCLESIAAKYGYFWEKLWDHPENAELKKRRKDPNLLFPGDELVLPEKETRSEKKGTGQRHRFVKKGVPSRLEIEILVAGQPRANEPYVLEVDGKEVEGTTDADGWLREGIPPGARQATLRFPEDNEEYELALGHIDPIDEAAGAQARLANLGFYSGAVDGVSGELTQAAIKDFQRARDLPVTGEIDAETRAALEDEHGC